MWWVWLVFCDCGFHSICPLTHNDKRLTEGETDWGKLDLVLMDRSCSVKYWIQFSVDHQGCVPSMLFDLRSNYGGGNEDNGDLLQMVSCRHCHTHCSQHCGRPPPTHASSRDSWTLTGKSGLVSWWGHFSFRLGPVHGRFCLCPQRVCFPSPV